MARPHSHPAPSLAGDRPAAQSAIAVRYRAQRAHRIATSGSGPTRIGNPADIAYACAWKPPRGLLAGFPNLKAIFSLGAGVDHLIADPTLPDVPIVRIVDPDLTSA